MTACSGYNIFELLSRHVLVVKEENSQDYNMNITLVPSKIYLVRYAL